jgi:3-mercaptopyruvate sulfurtransferase SseA
MNVGYTNVLVLKGGWNEWVALGYPTVTGAGDGVGGTAAAPPAGAPPPGPTDTPSSY